MPRRPRLNLPGVPLHVVQRGNNRRPCFLTDSDRLRFLNFLKIESVRSECAIHAFVLMSNHFHLLLTPENDYGASSLMMGLGRNYVRYFNDLHDRTGTLWEGRFKSSPVESHEYCMACYRYIELNPVRAGMVCHPGSYPWSSYRINGMAERSNLITPHPIWIGLGDNTAERTEMYRSLVGLPLDEGVLHDIRMAVSSGNSV